MKLSKQESKYRKKFIAEGQYNKYEQKDLDEKMCSDDKVTYKQLYINFKIVTNFLSNTDSKKVNSYLNKLNIRYRDATGNYNNLSDILQQIDERICKNNYNRNLNK